MNMLSFSCPTPARLVVGAVFMAMITGCSATPVAEHTPVMSPSPSMSATSSPSSQQSDRVFSLTDVQPAPPPSEGDETERGPVLVATGGSNGDESYTVGAQGTPQLVFFVSHACVHCQQEVPKLVERFTSQPPDGFDLVGVTTSAEWLQTQGWPGVIIEEGPTPDTSSPYPVRALQAFQLGAVPTAVAIGPDGVVLSMFPDGVTSADIDTLVQVVSGHEG